MITIRRIRAKEVELYQHIRLMSLKDAPYAFSSTYDSALERSLESWREQVERSAQGRDRATFVVVSDETPVGVAALYRLEERTDTGELLQVWVRPDYRGTGVAWELMDAIFEWAAENNIRRVIAGLTKANDRALKFYIKYGFALMDEVSANDAGITLGKEVK